MFGTFVDTLIVDKATHRLKGDSVLHREIEINLNFQQELDETPAEEWFYDFENGDYGSINRFLLACDWCVRVLENILFQLMCEFVPLKMCCYC